MRSKRVRYALVIVGVTATLIVIGLNCGPRSRYPAADMQSETARRELAVASAQLAAEKSAEAQDGSGAGISAFPDLAATQRDLYLIKNATITLEAVDSRAATEKLVASLEPLNGYVSNLNEHVDGLGRRTVTLQVRIPATAFDQSLVALEALGKVMSKQVSTQDVTEEYLDTESRSRNLKKTEERLLDHLNRAAQLEDILRVEQELTRVREEIERLEGRLRFLQDRVSFSTITVTIQESAKAEPIVPPQSFSTAREFSKALRSLVAFLQGVWSRIIWVFVWLPMYVLPAGIAWYVFRRIRRRYSS